MRINRFQKSSGFSLLEVVLSIFIAAVITAGLAYIYRITSFEYQKQFVIDDVTNYGNGLVDEIAELVRTSYKIRTVPLGEYTRVRLEERDGKVHRISFDPSEGLIIDGRINPPPIPTNPNFVVTVSKFKMKTYSTAGVGNYSQDYVDLMKSIFQIQLHVEVEYIRDDVSVVLPIFTFERDVFSAEHYL